MASIHTLLLIYHYCSFLLHQDLPVPKESDHSWIWTDTKRDDKVQKIKEHCHFLLQHNNLDCGDSFIDIGTNSTGCLKKTHGTLLGHFWNPQVLSFLLSPRSSEFCAWISEKIEFEKSYPNMKISIKGHFFRHPVYYVQDVYKRQREHVCCAFVLFQNSAC